VSEVSGVSTHRLLFSFASTIKIQLITLVLVKSGNHQHPLIEMNISLAMKEMKNIAH
jgi:hypothetical protein